MPVSVTITIKVHHCVNGDGLFDGEIGFGTRSVHWCKFDGDCDEDGDGDSTCKETLNLNLWIAESALTMVYLHCPIPTPIHNPIHVPMHSNGREPHQNGNERGIGGYLF